MAAKMKATAAKRPHLPRVYDVCQALNSIAKMLKKPASKRMNVATSGNDKDYYNLSQNSRLMPMRYK